MILASEILPTNNELLTTVKGTEADSTDDGPSHRNHDTSSVTLGRFVSKLSFIFDQAQKYTDEKDRANILAEREKQARNDTACCKEETRKLYQMVRNLKSELEKTQSCQSCYNLRESTLQFFQKLSPMLDGPKTEGDAFVVSSQGYIHSDYWHSLGMQKRVDAIDKIFDDISQAIKGFKQNQLQNVYRSPACLSNALQVSPEGFEVSRMTSLEPES